MSECKELAVHPNVNLIAHTFEFQHGVCGSFEIHGAPIEETSIDVGKSHVLGSAWDRKSLRMIERMNAIPLTLEHIFPIAGNGVWDHFTFKHREPARVRRIIVRLV